MICKNCKSPILKASKFCNNCGAKIITERLTVKNLWSDVTQNIFGWDNKFFFTIKSLIIKPGELLSEYFDGTRKKYVNPFTFLAIGMAINLFAFTAFDEEFLSVMGDFNKGQLDWFANNLGGIFTDPEFQAEQLQKSAKTSRVMLKYFNLLAILFMPFYTFLAFLVYRKPFNYGEHLVVNCYIQGFSFLTTSIVFFISILLHPAFYLLIYPLLILYYTYVYGKLYKFSVGQSILKIIIFLAVLMGAILLLGILGVASGYLYAVLSS